mgnify:CR=1 FL=1
MKERSTIGVVIPCFMGSSITIKIVREVLEFADHVVLVDDQCPNSTGEIIATKINNPKLHIIFNKINLGVGGSSKNGFAWLLDKDCDIILKVDADGQISASDIPRMCGPILRNECDSTKGNRFTNLDKILSMPKTRLIGNVALSFISKISTGYWELFDPTNGFVAFRSNVLRSINLRKTDDRFFFETDLLFRCSLKNICIKNVDIEPIYNNSYSSLNPIKEIPNFFFRHSKLIIKRVIYQYFILDFNPGSIEIVLSFILALFSFLFGIFCIYLSHITGNLTSAGTASLFSISVIVSIQLFLSFIYYDCAIRPLTRKNLLNN